MATPTPPHNVGNDKSRDAGSFPGWDTLAGGEVGRRTLIKGAAWATPVIALTVATPLAAASTEPPLMDVAVSTLATANGYAFSIPAPVGSQNGESVWQDNQTVRHYLGIRNLGEAEIPAGTTFTLIYPNSGAAGWQMFGSGPTMYGLGSGNTTPGVSTTTVTPVGPATVTNGVLSRTFVIGVPIPVGTQVGLGFQINILNMDSRYIYTGTYIRATVALPAGLIDSDPSNNEGRGPAFSVAGYTF